MNLQIEIVRGKDKKKEGEIKNIQRKNRPHRSLQREGRKNEEKNTQTVLSISLAPWRALEAHWCARDIYVHDCISFTGT